MKRRTWCFTVVIIMLTLCGYAQSRKTVFHAIQPLSSSVKRPLSLDTALAPAVAGRMYAQVYYDSTFLYIMASSTEASTQRQILRSGLNIEIKNTVDKKTAMLMVTPFVDQESKRALRAKNIQSQDIFIQEMLGSVRGYWTSGFPALVEGLLSLNNSYGVHSQVALEKGTLLISAVIPRSVMRLQPAQEIQVQLAPHSLKKIKAAAVSYNPAARGNRSPAAAASKGQQETLWFKGIIN